jgi:hypothetical protein
MSMPISLLDAEQRHQGSFALPSPVLSGDGVVEPTLDCLVCACAVVAGRVASGWHEPVCGSI